MRTWLSLLFILLAGVPDAAAQPPAPQPAASEFATYRQHLARASTEERRLIAEVLVTCRRALKATAAITFHAGTCEDSYLRWQLLFAGNPEKGTPRAVVGGALHELWFAANLRSLVAGHPTAEKEPLDTGLTIVVHFTTAFLTSTP